MNDNNTIPIGLLLGAIIPVIGFVLFEGIFNGLELAGLIEEATVSSMGRRQRTIALLAICTNLLPFNFAKKRKLDNIMRGIIFPTLVYVGGWIYTYYDVLF